MWAKIPSNTGSYYKYIFSHAMYNTNPSVNFFVAESSAPAYANYVEIYMGDNGTGMETMYGNASVADNNWHYITVTRVKNGTDHLYVDGSSQATATGANTSINPTGDINIGRREDGDANRYFGGYLDEIRVSNTERTACWIGTEYNNQNSPSTFYSISSQQAGTPTAVILNSFTAIEYEGKVLLQWKTGYEANNLGFHVYRDEDGQLTQVNPELVTGGAFLAGINRATAGHAYAWVDILPEGTGLTQYWLEDIDLSGKRTMNGPVTPDLSLEPLPERCRAALLGQLSRGQSEKDKIASRLWTLQARLGKNQPSAISN